MYLAFNQKNEALQDVKVRQAINHAIDKEAAAEAVAAARDPRPPIQFMPDLVNGYNPNVDDVRRTTSRRPSRCSRRPARRT